MTKPANPARRRVLIIGAILLGAAAVFARAATAPSSSVAAPFEGEPAIVAATFSSAFCAPCKVLKPRLAKAMPAFEDRAVKFVEYDFTFRETDDMRVLAEIDGLADAFDRFAPATGYTLLVEPATGEIVDMLTMDHSPAAMRAALAQALARAEAP